MTMRIIYLLGVFAVLQVGLNSCSSSMYTQKSEGVESKAQKKEKAAILNSIQKHKQAVLIKDDIWIRDPYIVLGPDDYYYLTGTTRKPGEKSVGWKVRVWKSYDLVNWEYAGTPFTLLDGYWAKADAEAFKKIPESRWHLWAPELHFVDGKWIIVHATPGSASPVERGSNFAVTEGKNLEGPYQLPLGKLTKGMRDPSVFQDTDGRVYLIYNCTEIAALSKDYTHFIGTPHTIYPSTLREMPNGTKEPGLGHEGATILKIGSKYVQFGTGWSTNRMRRGSYNLYYTVADHVEGPYGERQFAGRFLGHGTPFRDKQGRWWCTAFYNANVPPLPKAGIITKDLRKTAQTINHQGVTLVPLDIEILQNGNIEISSPDPAYAVPGPDEAQKF